MRAIIYLIGPSGAGKLTISKEICRQCPSLKLIHNHHISNVIFDIINPDGRTKLPEYVWENVKAVRTAVLNTVRATDMNEGYIFTNVLSEGCADDVALYKDISQIATEKSLTFCPVRIIVDIEQLCTRIRSPERAAMMKDISEENARDYYRTHTVLIPKDEYLELDVSATSPQESAAKIVQWVRGIGAT